LSHAANVGDAAAAAWTDDLARFTGRCLGTRHSDEAIRE
jgi:hypothetical protein